MPVVHVGMMVGEVSFWWQGWMPHLYINAWSSSILPRLAVTCTVTYISESWLEVVVRVCRI